MTDLPTTAEVAPTAPPPDRTAPTRVCPNCSSSFDVPIKGPGGHKRFCGEKCRTTWRNREKAEGAVIVTLAKIWRQNRGSGHLGKLAFARLTETLDVLNAKDSEEGRIRLNAEGPLKPYIRDVLAEPYIDRMGR